MSSACVCHLKEWCFYCEMYAPVKKERDTFKRALQKIVCLNIQMPDDVFDIANTALEGDGSNG